MNRVNLPSHKRIHIVFGYNLYNYVLPSLRSTFSMFCCVGGFGTLCWSFAVRPAVSVYNLCGPNFRQTFLFRVCVTFCLCPTMCVFDSVYAPLCELMPLSSNHTVTLNEWCGPIFRQAYPYRIFAIICICSTMSAFYRLNVLCWGLWSTVFKFHSTSCCVFI